MILWFLGFIGFDIFLKCRLLRQIFLGIPWITKQIYLQLCSYKVLDSLSNPITCADTGKMQSSALAPWWTQWHHQCIHLKQNGKKKKEKTAVEPTLYTLPAHFPKQRTPDSPAPGWTINKGHGLWQKEVHLLTQLHPNLQQPVQKRCSSKKEEWK